LVGIPYDRFGRVEWGTPNKGPVSPFRDRPILLRDGRRALEPPPGVHKFDVSEFRTSREAKMAPKGVAHGVRATGMCGVNPLAPTSKSRNSNGFPVSHLSDGRAVFPRYRNIVLEVSATNRLASISARRAWYPLIEIAVDRVSGFQGGLSRHLLTCQHSVVKIVGLTA
jgi:hypothetical protein